MHLGEYLKARGVRQKHFAKKLGICKETVWRFCSGRSMPGPQTMMKIHTLTFGAVNATDQTCYFVEQQKDPKNRRKRYN